MEAAVVSHADWAALAEAAPGVELHAIDEELVPLRIRKTPTEVDAIGRACALTDACFEHLVEFVRPGMTEQEVALELERWFRMNGAEGLAFESIVLAGAARRDAARPALGRQHRARQRAAHRLRVHRRWVSVRHDAHAVRGRGSRRDPPLPRCRARGAAGGDRRDRRSASTDRSSTPSHAPDRGRGGRAVRARARSRDRARDA